MKCQQQSTLSPTPIPSSPSILISGGKRHNILPCCSPNTFTVPLVKFTFLLSHISFSCQSPSLYLTTLYNSSQSLSSLSSPLRISSLCVSFFFIVYLQPASFLSLPSFPTSTLLSNLQIWSPSSWSSCTLSVPLSSLVSSQALLQWLCLVCQPVKLLCHSTSCW